MKARKLGNELTVSSIGFGCMGLSHAYGVALEKDTAIRRIHEAFEKGYTFFDTAEVYVGQYADGSPAVNEDLVGEALRPLRNKVIIATKGGIHWGNDHQTIPDASPASLRRSLENSLKRMGVETIDLYYQHKQDPAVEPEAVAQTMNAFIREGKIRYWGISNASSEYTAPTRPCSRCWRNVISAWWRFLLWQTAFYRLCRQEPSNMTRTWIFAAVCRNTPKTTWKKAMRCSTAFMSWHRKKMPRRHKYPLHGCSVKSRGLYPFPEHPKVRALWKMPGQPTFL